MELSGIRDSIYLYDTDEYIIERIPEKILEKSQISSPHTYIFLSRTNVRWNDIEQDKNNQFYAQSDIFGPISATLNILSLFLLAEFASRN